MIRAVQEHYERSDERLHDALAELRAAAAALPPAHPAMETYLEKVRERAYSITDADVEALKAAGPSEDEIFKQTVAAAVAEGFRRLDAATKAGVSG